jgi:type VI secretion system secreted protein VgrG
MTELSQAIHLETSGVQVTWQIVRVRGLERVGGTYRFEITCRPWEEDTPADLPDQLLMAEASLRLPLEGGGERVVGGLITEIDQGHEGLQLALTPRLALLTQVVDHRVFVEQDAVTIATDVLREHGFSVTNRAARALAPREQCVQAFEPVLGFVERILAEEGIAWFLDDQAKDTVVLVDSPAGFEDLPGAPLPVRAARGLITKASVFATRLRRAQVSDKLSMRDYNFANPKLDLSVSASEGEGRLERYEYRGGYRDPSIGESLAGIRLEEARARRIELEGRTNALHLVPGKVITLEGAPRDDINGRWLLLEVLQDAAELQASSEERRFEARFTAVPAGAGYRPPRPAAPRLGGVQTMTVCGPGGAEIHTEGHGRIKAHFRWDRRRPLDDTASAWMRVVQPPTSGGLLLPRAGWEALTGFWGASGDTPLNLGRLYNAHAPPPSAQPANKVVVSFGTRTTPGGGSSHHIAMNDAAGSEGMSFNATKDFVEKTENDKVTVIGADDALEVGAARELIVGQVHEVGVVGSQTYSVSGSRTVNVDANKEISCAAESVIVGGARIFDVGGDQVTQSASVARLVGGAKVEACIEHQSRVVTGASGLLVGGSWSSLAGLSAGLDVGGVATEQVAGPKSIKAKSYGLDVKASLTETYGARKVKAGGPVADVFKTTATIKVGGSATIQGAHVVVSATSKITLKAAGLKLTITSGEVKIDGKFKGSTSASDKNSEDYD